MALMSSAIAAISGSAAPLNRLGEHSESIDGLCVNNKEVQ